MDEREKSQADERVVSTAARPAAGLRHFGDYELLEEIGRGGMGVVYKARQLSLHRTVAVKMLLSGPFASAEFVRRFQSEAESAANLHHPNIVAIHDFGECEGQNFFSMDYVLGRNLAEVIHGKSLPPRQTARYVQVIAAAIAYAHCHGVLHRDLKPSNIIIDAEDQPRVTDFGLAKRMTLEQDMTLSGQALGSPNYMPPEQAAGDRNAIGPASDIFSIGAILYHLLAGRPPFLAETVTNTLRQVQEAEPIAPRLINPVAPRDLETICLKCLEKDPQRRYRTADDLVDELTRYLGGEPIRTRPVGAVERIWRWGRRNPKLAAVTCALVVFGVVLLVGTPWAMVRIERERKAVLSALHRIEIQRAEELFASDRAPEGVAVLASMLRQGTNDSAVAEWLMNELTHRSFAMPAVEPLRHDDMVFYAQFSLDGRRLLTVCRDNSARLWDPGTGQPITPPLQHDASLVHPGQFLGPDRPLFARLSADGTRVVTASVDCTARVWDSVTGQPLTRPLPHRAGVSCAQMTPDGKLLVTGSTDGKVQFWDATTGAATGPTLQHATNINSVEFSPNGQWLITASDDRTAQVWETHTKQPVGPRLRHSKEVRDASFSPDSQIVVTISSDYTTRLWHADTGEPVCLPLQHENTVNSARFCPDGLWVVTASWDKTARVWDAQSGQLVGVPLQHRGIVRHAQFSPEGLRVVTASEDGTARVWEARTGRPLTEPMPHNAAVWWADFAPDGWRVATASLDKSAHIWDVRVRRAFGPSAAVPNSPKTLEWSGQGDHLLAGLGRLRVSSLDIFTEEHGLRERRLSHSQEVHSAHYSRDGRRVVTASADQTAQIWDEKTTQRLEPPLQHAGIVYAARFSRDAQWVITASADHTARVWDAASHQECFQPMRHADVVYDADFSPNGRWVVTAGADQCARLWDFRSGRPVTAPLAHPAPVTAALFSPDGERILTVAADNTARLWRARPGTLLGQPMSHKGIINSAQFSPDGRWIVTASRDGTVRTWDAHTGQPTAEPMDHEGSVNTADFSPDSQRVVTASDDGTVRVWDAGTGAPRSPPFKHKLGALCARFHPSGRWLAVGSADNRLWLWNFVLASDSVPAWLPELAESVSGQRINQERRLEFVAAHPWLGLNEQLQTDPSADRQRPWLEWFLGDPVGRQSSPDATLTTGWIMGKRMDRAYDPSPQHIPKLEEALQVEPDSGLIVAQLARLLVRYGSTNLAARLASTDALSRRAVALRPEDALTWWARADYFALLGNQRAALDTMERGSRFGCENAFFWLAKGDLFEKAGRLDVAFDAFTKAIQVVEPMADWPRSSRNYLIHLRADFLERHGRLDEARLDRLGTHDIFPRDPQIPSRFLDLWTAYNAGLAERETGQPGPLDFGTFPRQVQNLGGVPFYLMGAVQLASPYSDGHSPPFPQSVPDIPVRQSCRRLHFLHAADTTEADGTQIGAYAVCYGDGTSLEIPVVYGRDVLAWNSDSPRSNSAPVVAWKGVNPSHVPVQLFKSSWENPRPDVMIDTIDFLSNNAKAAPFLVAITAEP